MYVFIPCGEYVYSLTEDDWFYREVELVCHVVCEAVVVCCGPAQDGDGFVSFLFCICLCVRDFGIDVATVFVFLLRLLNASCEDDAVPFRERFDGGLVCVVADDDRVALFELRAHEVFVFFTRPVGHVLFVARDLSVCGDRRDCYVARFFHIFKIRRNTRLTQYYGFTTPILFM